jgi:hypothetical protein
MNFLKDPNKMRFVSLIVAVIGLFLILNSPRLGSISTSSWLRSVGGSEDSQKYLQMLEGYIDSYRVIGSIFLFTGLFSILNKNDNK